jgi:N-methylhydantoinase B
MMGGYPSTTNAYTFLRDTDIAERFARARMIEDTAEVRGTPETLGLRQENFMQYPTDVYAVRWTGGGGFGDPLDRDPADIERDLEDLAITPAAARSLYGAVLRDALHVDAAATAAHRTGLRQARLARHAPRCARRREGALLFEAGASLHLRQDAGGSYWACAKCGSELGAVGDNYKEHCLREDHPVSASNPLIGDPAQFIDDAVAFRQFCCPGCGAQIDNEIAVTRDPVLCDIAIRTG